MNLARIRKLKFFLRDYWPSVMTIVSIIVLTVLISFSYRSFKESSDQRVILNEEVRLLKNRNDTLNYNKTLTTDQIETYNKILSTLIPEAEDFFSIIYALETISQQTGFNIVAYTINLSKSTPEKIAIIIEGRGSINQFKNFLNNYKFSGGRLVTSERIEFAGGSITNTKVALNFYNKRYAFGETVIPQLTKKDVDKLESIKDKIQLSFTDAISSDEDYETKQDPF